jgi:hypothetical protein
MAVTPCTPDLASAAVPCYTVTSSHLDPSPRVVRAKDKGPERRRRDSAAPSPLTHNPSRSPTPSHHAPSPHPDWPTLTNSSPFPHPSRGATQHHPDAGCEGTVSLYTRRSPSNSSKAEAWPFCLRVARMGVFTIEVSGDRQLGHTVPRSLARQKKRGSHAWLPRSLVESGTIRSSAYRLWHRSW